MTAFLTTERLFLRPLQESDADGPYPSWFNDARTCAGNSHHIYPYSRQDAIDYIRAVSGDKTRLVLAMTLQSDKRHVGNASLQRIDLLNRSAELAIMIGDQACRGQGLGSEACRAMVKHGFRTLNLHRISFGTFANNNGMIRIGRELGFKEEGRLMQAAFKDGQYVDVCLFGLLAYESSQL